MITSRTKELIGTNSHNFLKGNVKFKLSRLIFIMDNVGTLLDGDLLLLLFPSQLFLHLPH